ncbi:3-hydroxyanthranilate 3,4-dioxygenase [Flexibacter flexilis DSM 6793]|uniref:3-hydroxyanthranilate 3,4-dioxygenase n=1 Tax=Flexibacter flexilis DSM 6793 TaxID=927664 RepID=A0A1I1NDE4_9BACT|nr:3-hydroxyanthranilate 3,4-dioxygenase [Flexibacter flexilis]SFC95649.1 3-hydroxyanthranilate 3,4-dioxygenase [Flexibacter flexilis DSM 6793]
MVARPFNLLGWIEDNRHLLRPPVGNQVMYKANEDFIVMVVGGPNSRRDYHYNEGEEIFYQIEGDIELKIIEDGRPVSIPIRQGEIFLLPPRVPHSPRRPANTVGLVIERYRAEKEQDGFLWYCENCGEKLYEEYAHVSDIVAQLPPIMNRFFENTEHCTCKKCGTVMQRPS